MLFAVVIAVIVYSRWRSRVCELLELQLPSASSVAPRPEGSLRVATWNLRNFPFTAARAREGEGPHDLERMRDILESLDADVIAVQEVHEAEALTQLAEGYRVLLSDGGGRNHQRLGLLLNPARVQVIGEPREHDSITLGGRVRPALSVLLRARTGLELFVIVVHLKARPQGLARRREQWAALAEIIAQLQIERAADADADADARDPSVVVLGDFNTTGSAETGGVEREFAALDRALAGVELRRLDAVEGCSAYWEGSRRDAWKEPSWLDQIVVSKSLLNLGPGEPKARVAAHCARHRCAPFRSTASYPDPDFVATSDHCPLWADLGRP